MPSKEDLFAGDLRYIRTISGKKFFLNGVDPAEIDIEDIAHALSHIGRFTGHTERFYSVAEHSLLVTKMVHEAMGVNDPWLLLSALMHDSTEAYLADISSPFKGALTNYADLEDRVWQRIAFKFGVNPVMDPCIKEADWVALFAESLVLQPKSEQHTWYNWNKYGEEAMRFNDKIGIPNLCPVVTKHKFLRVFRELLERVGDDYGRWEDSPSRYPS